MELARRRFFALLNRRWLERCCEDSRRAPIGCPLQLPHPLNRQWRFSLFSDELWNFGLLEEWRVWLRLPFRQFYEDQYLSCTATLGLHCSGLYKLRSQILWTLWCRCRGLQHSPTVLHTPRNMLSMFRRWCFGLDRRQKASSVDRLSCLRLT